MSSNTKHHRSDTKAQIWGRNVTAFILFLAIAVLSLSVCVKVCFVSKSEIVRTFTSDVYVEGMTNDVLNYSHDLCDECSIPYDSVDGVIDCDVIYEIQRAYFSGMLGESDDYTTTTYLDKIETLGNRISDETQKLIENRNIEAYVNAKAEVSSFAKHITDYVTSITEISYTGRFATIIKLGNTATWIAIAVSLLPIIICVLILVSIGRKLYRAIRAAAFSLFAASALNLLLVAGVKLVGHFKSLVLYPLYMSDAIMQYVNDCLMTVTVSSFVLFLLGLATTCFVWDLKRQDNK